MIFIILEFKQIYQFDILRVTMLSKQQKLRYGEELRRQMKEKEQKKHIEIMQKRGVKKSPTDPRIIPRSDNQYQNSKQELQKKFGEQNYVQFGKPGGGAPNRNVQRPTHQDNSQQQPLYQPYLSQGQPQNPKQNIYNNSGNNQLYYQDAMQQRNYGPQYGVGYPTQDYREMPANKFNQPQPNYRQYDNYREGENYGSNYQQLAENNRYESYRQAPIEQPRQQLNYYERQPTERSAIQYYPEQTLNQQMMQQYQKAPVYNHSHSPPTLEANHKPQFFREKTMQNEQLMEIHKKGGRNLLQLENMTIDQQQIKQKQKQEMRKQLQLQIRQVEERKKREIEQKKQEQRQEERRNQQYLLQQKMKLEEQERQKNEKQRQLIQQNERSLQQKKKLEEQAKEKARRGNMKVSNVKKNSVQADSNLKQRQMFTRQAQIQLEGAQTTSEVSSSTVLENAFRTDISKQFFEGEQRKKQQRQQRKQNLELVARQVQLLRDEIESQNRLFHKQIAKVKIESEMAENQKAKALKEIEQLKTQLTKKIDDDNQRLYKALQRQQELEYGIEEEYRMPRKNKGAQQQPVQVLRPNNSDRFVNRKYNLQKQERKYDPRLEQSNVSEDGLVSLRGDSKKIPINLPNDKLSMSQLSEYARETQFKGNMNKKNNTKFQQSIVEEDEERVASRANNRNDRNDRNNFRGVNPPSDELDKMVESREKFGMRGKAWGGQLSSVNDEAIRQIDELLKNKDKKFTGNAGYNYQNAPDYNSYNYELPSSQTNERPSSNMSNAGKRVISHQGLDYQGASLNTINSKPGTLKTIDIDHINNRNQARLNQFRKMGVETINTNNDGQLMRLDQILNKYKDGKSR